MSKIVRANQNQGCTNKGGGNPLRMAKVIMIEVIRSSFAVDTAMDVISCMKFMFGLC